MRSLQRAPFPCLSVAAVALLACRAALRWSASPATDEEAGPVWSPTGDRILYGQSVPGAERALKLVSARGEGEAARRVTAGPGLDTDAQSSPDGRRIAFIRTPERGSPRLLVVERARWPSASRRRQPRRPQPCDVVARWTRDGLQRRDGERRPPLSPLRRRSPRRAAAAGDGRGDPDTSSLVSGRHPDRLRGLHGSSPCRCAERRRRAHACHAARCRDLRAVVVPGWSCTRVCGGRAATRGLSRFPIPGDPSVSAASMSRPVEKWATCAG
jgi:WD40-like Beta Propeller Repeat